MPGTGAYPPGPLDDWRRESATPAAENWTPETRAEMARLYAGRAAREQSATAPATQWPPVPYKGGDLDFGALGLERLGEGAAVDMPTNPPWMRAPGDRARTAAAVR